MNNKFKDPYSHLTEEERIKVTAFISKEDMALLRRVRLYRGTLQTTINLLVRQLCEELRAKGIVDYDQSREFEEYVGYRSTISGDYISRGVEELIVNDGGGVESAHRKTEKKSRKRSVIPS